MKRRGIFTGFMIAMVCCMGFQPGTLPGQPVLCDPMASQATIRLYAGMFKAMEKGIMFGHQDDLAYGVNWKYEAGKSDTKLVTGEYPAVYGWELGNLELGSPCNLDSVPFDKMKQFIRQAYERGGVNTISWHLNNPLTGKNAWDTKPGTVASILPGGSKHAVYVEWLDRLSAFLLDLRNAKGELIPVLFRPFHELNGNWFWWGGNYCTPEEFKALWRFTVGYLRDTKGIHHLMYTFNTDKFNDKDTYLERYPGDNWVDVIGFDVYQRDMSKEQYTAAMNRMLSDLTAIATERNKLPALTEFGGNNATDSKWWTGTFLPILKQHTISYVLGWRNAGKKADGSFEYYIPYPGEHSEADFRTFYSDNNILFEKKTAKLKLY